VIDGDANETAPQGCHCITSPNFQDTTACMGPQSTTRQNSVASEAQAACKTESRQPNARGLEISRS